MTRRLQVHLFIGFFTIAAMLFFMRADVSAATKLKSGNVTYYVSDECLYMTDGVTTKYLTNNVLQLYTIYNGNVYYGAYREGRNYDYKYINYINPNTSQIYTVKFLDSVEAYIYCTNGRYIVYSTFGGDGVGSGFKLYSLDCASGKIYKLAKNIMLSSFMIANNKVYYATCPGQTLKIYRCTFTGKKKKLRNSCKIPVDGGGRQGCIFCERMKKYYIKVGYNKKNNQAGTTKLKFKK